jgi:hypothetical protein
MGTATALRAEAAQLGRLARGITDRRTLVAIVELIKELNQRALALEIGDAGSE